MSHIVRKRSKTRRTTFNSKTTAFARSTYKDAQKLVPHHTNDTRLTDEVGPRWDCFDPSALYDPSIRYRSLSQRQLLAFTGGRALDTIDLKGAQLDSLNHRMVETSDRKILTRSDTTLLLRGKPGKEIGTFARITSRTKETVYEREIRPDDTDRRADTETVLGDLDLDLNPDAATTERKK
jgi:hypothetical protein